MQKKGSLKYCLPLVEKDETQPGPDLGILPPLGTIAVSYTHLDVYKRQKYNRNSEKRRLLFFGHLYRMDDNRLTKQIFKYL